jgi:hypothetical protein
VEPGQCIFLSHASADRKLADLFRDTLILGGVAEDRIFYSADRATGIPSGEDVGTYLRTSLRETGLVIELLSETFLSRPMCLMELGAAWALNTPTYPIVVPPLLRDTVSKDVGNLQMGVLGTDDEVDAIFEELSGRLDRDVRIRVQVAAWNRAVRGFKQQLRSISAMARAAGPSARTSAQAGGPVASEWADEITTGDAVVGVTAPGKEPHGEATNHGAVMHTVTAMLEVTVPEGFDVQRPNRLRDFRTWLSHPIGAGSDSSSKKYPIEGQVAPLLPGGAVAISIRTNQWHEQGVFPLCPDGSFSGHVYLHESQPPAIVRFRILGADDSILKEYVVQVT